MKYKKREKSRTLSLSHSLPVCLSRLIHIMLSEEEIIKRGLSLTSLSLARARAHALSISRLHITYLSLNYQHMAHVTNLLQEFSTCRSLFHALFAMFTCVCFFHIVLIADLRDNCQLSCIRSLHKT